MSHICSPNLTRWESDLIQFVKECQRRRFCILQCRVSISVHKLFSVVSKQGHTCLLKIVSDLLNRLLRISLYQIQYYQILSFFCANERYVCLSVLYVSLMLLTLLSCFYFWCL